MNDDCNCSGCQLRRRMEAARLLSTMQPEEPVTVPTSFEAAQENLVLAQTVDLLTMSLERAYNCNEENVAVGIRRTLEQLLDTKGSVGTANETPADPAEGTADAAARSANAPLSDDVMDELPPALRSLFSALTAFGADVQVMRFPKQ